MRTLRDGAILEGGLLNLVEDEGRVIGHGARVLGKSVWIQSAGPGWIL
jgi:hypothetical protein